MGYRLPYDLQDELSWYLCDSGAALGVRSSMGGIQAQLLRTSPAEPTERPKPGAALARYAAAGPEERLAMREERWKKQDEVIRLSWLTLSVCGSGPTVSSEPNIAPETYERVRIVHASLLLLVRAPRGNQHCRVLALVYGNTARARETDERQPLVACAAKASDREALLVEASHAYSRAHAEAQAEHRAQAQRRRRARLNGRLRESA
jgi:hypothetical protein